MQVNQIMQTLFEKAQRQATNADGKFTLVYKCAAFCKILFHVGYIEKINTEKEISDKNAIINFASTHYKLDVSSALRKPTDIGKYITRKIGNNEPLKNCFNKNVMIKYFNKVNDNN